LKFGGDRALAGRPWFAYGTLVGLYLLAHLPNVIAVKDYTSLAFPLAAQYVSRLLFSGMAVRGDLADTLVTPANGALIYPPGIYFADLLLPDVASIFYLLFALQLAVAPLLYRMLRELTSPGVALLAAGLSVIFFVQSNWVAPDFLIQPFMIVALLVLLHALRGNTPRMAALVLAGMLAGLIAVFKHNVGVFFAILCGTLLFLNNFQLNDSPAPSRGRWTAFVLLGGFFVFAMVFGLRILYWDELVFYLLPYILFWLMFAAFLRIAPLAFDAAAFMRQTAAFTVAALLLPATVFIAFGGVIGYAKYWHALFGMGLEFLHLWDHGIVGIIREQHLSFTSPAASLRSVVVALMFLAPLLVNSLAVGCLYVDSKTQPKTPAERLAHFRVGALGVMATFMFFPLEGYHILATKLFIYLWVGLFFLERCVPRAVSAVAAVSTLALVPVLLFALTRPVAMLRMEVASGIPEVQHVIGMPMQKDIAHELSNQVEVLRRATRAAPYFIIDPGNGTLIGLAAFVDPVLPQYYIEMRDGILNRAVTTAIKADIARRPFVVVNTADYARRNERATDPYLREILALIDQRYTPIDTYRPPDPKPASFQHLVGFTVFKARDTIAAAQ